MPKDFLTLLTRLEALLVRLGNLADGTDKPISLPEAADYLHISKSHLYQLTGKGLIAHYKPTGKKIYFEKKDLDRYLLRNRVASAEEIEGRAASNILNHSFDVKNIRK